MDTIVELVALCLLFIGGYLVGMFTASRKLTKKFLEMQKQDLSQTIVELFDAFGKENDNS